MILDKKNLNFRYVYVYCKNAKQTDKGYEFEIKPYRPSNTNLQLIASDLKAASRNQESCEVPWVGYLKQGLATLGSQTEQDFTPPSIETDKLYMSIGERDLIEVAHPIPQNSTAKR